MFTRLKQTLTRWLQEAKKYYLNRHDGVCISPSATVAARASLDLGAGEIVVSDGCQVCAGAKLLTHGGTISMGRRSTVNPYTILYGHGGLKIGDGVRIAAHCCLIPANHVYDDPDAMIYEQGLRREGIQNEDDVWVGAGCQILDGVTIGEGSVIGAGSVVTKSIPSYSVAVGTPAEVRSSRN